MKTTKMMKVFTTICLFCAISQIAFGQGTAFTYQGRLNDGASPATGIYDLRFTIYDLATNGTLITGPVTNSTTGVSNGLFTVTLDFGATPFTGADRWLEIGVRTNGPGTFATLSPRQTLTPTPYAIAALNAATLTGTLPASQVSGLISVAQLPAAVLTNGQTGVNLSGNFTGDGGGLTNLNASQFSSGTGISIQQNAGSGAPNIIEGSPVNFVAPGVVGATIGGGGANNYEGLGAAVSNRVTGNYGTVPGGLGNIARGDYSTAMGFETIASGYASTAMGDGTTASGDRSTAMGSFSLATNNNSIAMGNDAKAYGSGSIAMGSLSTASGDVSTAMGYNSTASGLYSVAAGESSVATNEASTAMGLNAKAYGYASTAMGYITTASGDGSTALGYNTTASGTDSTAMGSGSKATNLYTFAAGLNAQALNQGAFVWADSQGPVFSSTNNDSINIRARGGVRLVTGGAGLTLDGQPVLIAGSSGNGLSIQQNAGSGAPNIIEGSPVNFVAPGVVGATIGGGGANNYEGMGVAVSNSVTGNYGTVPGGLGNIASGDYSTAMGFETTASGYASTATGNGTTASGNRSVAMGSFSLATNNNSIAMGNDAKAYGSGSIAMGSLSTASGDVSTAMGYNSTASGLYSVAAGESSVATNEASTAVGLNAKAYGYASTALGYITTASGDGSTAMGYNTTASGTDSTAMGSGSKATNLYTFAAGLNAQALHQGAFVWADSQGPAFASTANDQFLIRAQGGVGVNMNNPGGASFYALGNRTNGWQNSVGWFENTSTATNAAPALRVFVDSGARTPDGALSVSANVTASSPNSLIAEFGNASSFVVTITNDGTIYSKGLALTSDRNAKTNFTTLDATAVLAKVTALPVTRWNYKEDSTTKRHIGPVAQDFHSAFGLNGDDDTHISVVDESGVALAAIQGLNQKLNEKDAEIADLKVRLEKLEQLMNSRTADIK